MIYALPILFAQGLPFLMATLAALAARGGRR